ncbi:hypothetical protein P4O66_019090, partial [Electrophorus voltai]
MHISNHIIKFADDTTVVGLINKDNESAYREEVQELVSWCKVNNLYLNVDKTKEMVVDFRRARQDHSPLPINCSSVEIVKNIKFLTENLTWTLNPEHQFHHQESPATSLLPSEAEGSPSPITHPHYLLQRYCREHPEQLHHYLYLSSCFHPGDYIEKDIFKSSLVFITENLKVVGPSVPLVVNAGEDLVLPCSLQPNISAVDMTVEWLRPDLTQANRLVHLYEGHKDSNEDQIKSYRGRTDLFKEELQKGNTSLKLSAVQPSDEGDYTCLIQSESWYDDITLGVTVKVDFKVVGPAAPVVAVAGEDLVLPCSIHPRVSAEDLRVEWYRLYMRQTLVHLYEEYKDRNDEQIESYRGRTDLFKEELHKGNTSLKLSAVQPSDEGVYKCAVRSMSWYDDIPVYVEVR